MNTNISKKANNDFKRGLLKFMKNAVFAKAMENTRKYFHNRNKKKLFVVITK